MKVLVIEDDAALRATLEKGLTALGWNVESAVNGEDGLWAATEGSFDVVVCDIRMPVMNGYDVLKNLRERSNWTPLLMLTAKDGEYDQADAFELGADDYLTKPFSFVVLNARLHALTRRAVAPRPAALEVGTLVLDPAKHVVHRSGVSIELTSREFAVLEYLMRHAENVCSKLDILNNVWDSAYDGDPNIVEVYAGHLRKKIDAPFGTSTLKTVRGRGYMVSAD